jgi:hypothetical protein
MSRLLDRVSYSDEPSPYAPKWVRDAVHAERHGTAPSQEAADDAQQSTEIAASDQPINFGRSVSPAPGEGLVIDRYRLPRSLEPTIMSEPRFVRSGIRVLAGFVIAIASVGTVVLFVLGNSPTALTVSEKDSKEDAQSLQSRFPGQNGPAAEQPKLPVPQLNLRQERPRKSGEAVPIGASLIGAAEGASVVIEGLAEGTMVTAGQLSGANTWRISVSDLHNALVQPPRDYAGPMDIVLELRLADDVPVDRKPLRLEWAAVEPPQVNAATQSPADLKPVFEQFVENYTATTGRRTFSAREREVLFKKFQQFLDSKKSTRFGVHPREWTGGGPENRLTEPGFRGESPWLSTTRIRSSSSARSSRSFWAESHPTGSPSATASAAT